MFQNPWEIDWSNPEAIRRASQAPAPLIQGPPRQPDPRYPDEAARAQNQAEASAFDPRINEAQARKAEAEAALAQGELERGGVTPDQRQQMNIRAGNIEAASQRLLDVGRMYREGYQNEALGPISSLAEWLNLGPLTPGNEEFNTAGQGLVDATLPIVRVPGVGTQSDLEARMFAEANRVRASRSDRGNEAALDNIQNRLNAQRGQMGLPPLDWRNPDPDASPPPQGMDRTERAIGGSRGGDRRELSDGRTTLEEDPVLRGVASRLGSMLVSGASDREILDYLRRSGVNPGETNVDVALRYRRTPDFRAWRQQNPNDPYPIGESFFTREVRQTPTRQSLSNAAASPFGAYTIAAGDAVSFGLLDNFSPNPTQFRAGMEAMRERHPGASLAGSISGGIIGAGGAELAAAGVGLRGLKAMRAADATYGGAYGAGSADEGNRFIGAGTGALSGLGGGMAGRSVTRGMGRVLTGARDSATRYLTSRGIPETVGQIAGRGGVVGRAVRGMEDKLESIPLLGDAIRARRAEGVQAFNREAFSQALEPIGANAASAVGEQGVEQAQASVSDAYGQALSGVRVVPDDSFVTEMRAAIALGTRLPGNMAEEFRYTIQNSVAPELDNGSLTGEGFQAVRQALRQDRAAMRGQPRGGDYGRALRAVELALERMVRRQAPEVVPALNRADQAYGNTRIVSDAVARSMNNNDGGVFTPAQLGISARANARRYGGTQATTRRPFFELQRAGQEALPSTVPNSGTADRAWATAGLPMAAGGIAYGTGLLSPEHAGIMAVLGLPYTRKGQQTLQFLLTSRPEIVRQAGERLISYQRGGGIIGRGTAPPLLPNYGQ